MDHILIAASSDNSLQTLSDLLRIRYKNVDFTLARSAAKVRQMLAVRRFDLIVISAPLPDEPNAELAVHIAGMDIGVLLIVGAELADDIASRVGDSGVFVLEKPLNRVFFNRALQLLESYVRRTAEFRRHQSELQTKLDEQRFIGRAKCALVQYLGLNEQSAHRYIEKQAMDLRITRRQVAEDILNTYDSNNN